MKDDTPPVLKAFNDLVIADPETAAAIAAEVFKELGGIPFLLQVIATEPNLVSDDVVVSLLRHHQRLN